METRGRSSAGEGRIGLPDRVLTLRPRTWAIGLSGLAVLTVVLAVLLESDLVADLGTVAGHGIRTVGRLGVPASFAGLYLEESGAPVPVSGDVFVLYLGHHFALSAPGLVLTWLGLVAAVVAGSSNLYLISRRWGRGLAEGRLGLLFHLTPARLAAAERWFERWGVPTIVLGRHVFGLRVPITVAAGVLRVSYPAFAASVAVSTAVWAAVWLWLGVTVGHRLVGFAAAHRWAYVLPALGLALLAGGSVLVHARRRHGA